MKEIPLTQGKVALVDDEDYEELAKFKWCAHKDTKTFYAVSGGYKHTQIRMHRLILPPPEGIEIDHINGNGLDNRRENLRLISHRENCQNKHSPKSSKFPGVSWRKDLSKWASYIRINGKRKHLGFF